MPPALRNTHFHFAPASGGKRHEHASCRSRTELAPPTAAIPARLSSAEARERLARFGPNDPTAVRRGALALELLTLFLNPLVVILLVASMVSDFLGQPADRTIISLVVLMGPIAPQKAIGPSVRHKVHPLFPRDFDRQRVRHCARQRHRTGHGLGGIAERLAHRPEETEFEGGLRSFAMLILRAVFFLVLFTLVVPVALHKDAFESFVFAVALAVGLTPQFLQMIISVTLARGLFAWRKKRS